MAGQLEAPGSSDGEDLYLARGDEIEAFRPLFTGDVYLLQGAPDRSDPTRVVVIHHPCALRTNGSALVPVVLCAEVAADREFRPNDWLGNFKKMPLPNLPSMEGGASHSAVHFDKPRLLAPSELGIRLACLSLSGVNLLQQRWVHFTSRVIVPTQSFAEVVSGPFEEADLTEDWCRTRVGPGITQTDATEECLSWLRATPPGSTTMRQDLLADSQKRSAIRREARNHLKSLYGET